MLEKRYIMKKIILLLFTIILLSGCYKETNPQRFKGAVVVNKTYENFYNGNVFIKLTLKQSEEYGTDYLWIGVPKWELDKLNVGDTIK